MRWSLRRRDRGARGRPRRRRGEPRRRLHDARYCEILELTGAVPDAEVTVWNTIGLNDCPAARWEAIDAARARRRSCGDVLVIKNGPRHFLMDSATGEIGPRAHLRRDARCGRSRRSRSAPPPSSSQTPYTERTIERHNTWTWKAGRRVYELLAPDGSNYVMQSYSQIRDPELTLARPALARRSARAAAGLELPRPPAEARSDPPRERQRRRSSRTTFRTPTSALPRRSAAPKQHAVELTGTTRTVDSPEPGTLEDQGTVSGRPFGDGTVDLLVHLGAGTATGSFRIDAAKGSVFGTVAMDFVISGPEITFNGTADFTGGTGKYRGIEAHGLKAFDHNTLDGQSGTFTLEGVAEY